MRHSSGKKTQNAREQSVSSSKKSESQKKLVQARLPFKIVADSKTPTTSDGETLNKTNPSNPATPTSKDIRKRKLSFSESPNSGSKENLDIVSKKSKGVATTTSDTSDVVSVDSDLEILPTNSKHKKTEPSKEKPQSSDKRKPASKSNSLSTIEGDTPKLKIKLPISKKKRRKSNHKPGNRNNENITESSDDVEVAGSEMNPQKRVKIDVVNKCKVIDLDDEKSVETVNIEKVENSTETVEDRKDSRKSLRQLESKSNKNCGNDESKETNVNSAANDQGKVTEIIAIESDSNDGTTAKSTEIPSRAEKKKKVQITSKSKLKTLDAFISKGTKSHAEESKSKTEKTSEAKRKGEDITAKNKKNSVHEQCKTDNETDINDDDNIELSSSPGPNTSIANLVEKQQQQSTEKQLTPKQQKLYEQRKRAREEKELKLQQMKEERELKMQEEKLQRQREKEEKELARKREREEKEEQRRREKEEKEEARRKEREDKERKRVAEIEAKNEEKRKKDEAKDEERRRKELEKEEIEIKKKKAAEAFTKFFVAPKLATNDDDRESKEDVESFDGLAFRPFQIKGDMTMAPYVRKNFTENAKENLDLILKKSSSTSGVEDPSQNQSYLSELKSGNLFPVRWRRKTIDDSDEDNEVIIIEDSLERAGQAIVQTRQNQQRYRVKFFSFHENKRPPYYGTWRKKTSVITPRNPFVQDKTFFDYEVDSDDEWEEEEPGESLNGSEDEKEIESEDDDYEVDNEWFVPHGHLSDEEIQNEDEHKDTSREAQKAKLIALQQEFAQEMKKKTEKIKPRLLGCIWQDENGNQPELCPNVIWNSLNIRAMMFTSPPLIEEPQITEPEASSPQQEKTKRLELDDNLTKDLIRLVHGNRHSKVFLINEYLAHIEKTNETVKNGEVLIPHKSTVRDKIDEISAWQVIEGHLKKKKKKKKLCWIVNDEVLKKHTLDELSHLNGWSYTLQPKFVDTGVDNPTDSTVQQAQNLPENSTITLEVPSDALASTKKPDVIKKKKKITKINFAATVSTEDEKIQQTPSVFLNEHASENESKSISITDKPLLSQSPTQAEVVPKKRIPLLMSAPRGQQFSPSTKNALISQFLKKDKKPEKKIDSSNSDTTDEVVILD